MPFTCTVIFHAMAGQAGLAVSPGHLTGVTVCVLLLLQTDGEWFDGAAGAYHEEVGGDHRTPAAGEIRHDRDGHGSRQPTTGTTHTRYSTL